MSAGRSEAGVGERLLSCERCKTEMGNNLSKTMIDAYAGLGKILGSYLATSATHLRIASTSIFCSATLTFKNKQEIDLSVSDWTSVCSYTQPVYQLICNLPFASLAFAAHLRSAPLPSAPRLSTRRAPHGEGCMKKRGQLVGLFTLSTNFRLRCLFS